MTRAWVEIDLGALLRNGARLTERAGIPLLPMVKADAYGLGAVAVARALEALDPWGFGVATVAEGAELRRAGVQRPIIVFTPLLAGDVDAAQRTNLIPALGNRAAIARWIPTGMPWHLSVDTGMSRSGIVWTEVRTLEDLLVQHPPQGAYTHFHSADRGDGSRELQERRFREALDALPARPSVLHAENSPALERAGRSTWTFARPGIFLYGVGSGGGVAVEPVVSLRARIVDMRTIAAGESVSYDATWRAQDARTIATLGIGYADGYRRALGNRATVLVNGQRAPVVGLVTMDMTMIDVTGIECAIGDAVTLIGADGGQRLDVAEVAGAGDVSPYEFLTGLRTRVPRRYRDGRL